MGEYKFNFLALPASGFFGKNLTNKINFFINLLLAFFVWTKFIIRNRFEALIATGGFSSLVPLLGSIILKKPFFLLELNRIPGRITKYFARFAQEVYLAFPLAQSVKGNCYYTGSPLRQKLLATALNCQNNINSKFITQSRTPVVLVLGGSLGARALNLAAVELVNKYPEIKFIIQTGKRDYELIKEKVKSQNCQLVAFTLSPEENYAQACLVLTRAGGMVLSEILAFGLPAIIVPFPYATDRHQTANAQFLEKEGVAIVLNQDHLHELDNVFYRLLTDQEQLKRMSNKALRLAKYDATEKITERITSRLRRKICLVS